MKLATIGRFACIWFGGFFAGLALMKMCCEDAIPAHEESAIEPICRRGTVLKHGEGLAVVIHPPQLTNGQKLTSEELSASVIYASPKARSTKIKTKPMPRGTMRHGGRRNETHPQNNRRGAGSGLHTGGDLVAHVVFFGYERAWGGLVGWICVVWYNDNRVWPHRSGSVASWNW